MIIKKQLLKSIYLSINCVKKCYHLENIHSQIDVFEQLIDEYEDVAVENILERRKAKETRILDRYVEHLEWVYDSC